MDNKEDITQQSHFGVYSLILNDAKTEILLIKKAVGSAYTGLYDLPGGTPEPLELLEETHDREVLEETACTVVDKKQIGAVSVRYAYDCEEYGACVLRHTGVLYQANVTGTPRAEPDGFDSNGCVWRSIEDVYAHEKDYTPFVKKALACVNL